MTSNMGGDVTLPRQARPKSFQETRNTKAALSGILKIQQIEEGTHWTDPFLVSIFVFTKSILLMSCKYFKNGLFEYESLFFKE